MAGFVSTQINVSAYDVAQTLGVVYLVRDLAAMTPQTPDGRCVFCGAQAGGQTGYPHDHFPQCIWQRAKRIVDSGALDSPSDKYLATNGE